MDTRFKPGQSGNPGGRPKGLLNLTAMLRKELRARNNEKARELVKAAVEQAIDGKGGALKEVLDRIDGTVVQRYQQEDIERRVLETAERVLPEEHYHALLLALAAADGTGAMGGTPSEAPED